MVTTILSGVTNHLLLHYGYMKTFIANLVCYSPIYGKARSNDNDGEFSSFVTWMEAIISKKGESLLLHYGYQYVGLNIQIIILRSSCVRRKNIIVLEVHQNNEYNIYNIISWLHRRVLRPSRNSGGQSITRTEKKKDKKNWTQRLLGILAAVPNQHFLIMDATWWQKYRVTVMWNGMKRKPWELRRIRSKVKNSFLNNSNQLRWQNSVFNHRFKKLLTGR